VWWGAGAGEGVLRDASSELTTAAIGLRRPIKQPNNSNKMKMT